MSAKVQEQAKRSGNPNDWVMAGIAWIHEGRTDVYSYCQRMADALRRRQERAKEANDIAYLLQSLGFKG
jgi:hypothetical protein